MGPAPTPPPERRAKRITRPPPKLDVASDRGYNKAELAQAVRSGPRALSTLYPVPCTLHPAPCTL